MKYEEPNMQILLLDMDDIVTTSDLTTDGDDLNKLPWPGVSNTP